MGLMGDWSSARTVRRLSENQAARPSSSQPFHLCTHTLSCPQQKVKCFYDKESYFFILLFVKYEQITEYRIFLLTNYRLYA